MEANCKVEMELFQEEIKTKRNEKVEISDERISSGFNRLGVSVKSPTFIQH